MPLWDRIAELLSLPEDGPDAPTIEAIETTLTDGYAAALAIDAERLRMSSRSKPSGRSDRDTSV